MGIKTKATKGGKFVCKVGYLDVRHRLVMPKQEKNSKGEKVKSKGSVEATIYHGRQLYKGGFSDHTKAIEYVWEEIKKSNLTHIVSKAIISRYNLS